MNCETMSTIINFHLLNIGTARFASLLLTKNGVQLLWDVPKKKVFSFYPISDKKMHSFLPLTK